MSELNHDLKHEYLVSNRIRLHYVTQGKGPLMLMLHGFPEFWYSWRSQIWEFAQDHKVVALDLRGYNKSDKPQDIKAYAIAELVKDVKDVITGLGYARCILVGHDWGGAIAWNVAYAHPEMLDKLIVMNLPHPAKFSEALRSNPQQMLRSWYTVFFQLPWLPEFLLQLNGYQAISNAFRDFVIDKNVFTTQDLEAYKKAAAAPGALTAMVNYYRNIFPQILLPRDWDVLEVPTLMIWGENDKFLGKELTYETQDYVKNFQLQYIPNCSHWVQQEKPDLVNQYMREFLSL
ncbi:putative hydrolase or acyltransferase of alpha/beta superfamily [Xenococcus sp. PCC 7305]|uniref:alpha/beta fold hydrolase n=1 Tax=Xenococcus sp. PCC 7305 TaxID=102125 RepID=UPI0002ACB796|nr:alpha/beta hydrolase [Xenococcus sp. PCC 7305]ELS01592.1 putative hydrolase or acyltransferase of alpha/beta superfamily [Xenococcus sp. PCC 7305]